MGIHTQPQEGYGRIFLSVYSLCGYITTNFLLNWSSTFFPADHDDYPARSTMHVPDRAVPLPPTKTIYIPSTPSTPSTPSVLFQITAGVLVFFLFGSLMIVYAMLNIHSHPTRSSPSYPSGPACWEECGELVDITDDDMDNESSEGDDDEHAGDGDDYPGNGASDEADKLDEEEDIEDACSPSEDPPPPPDPPTQAAAAEPDSTPRSIPVWFLIFLFLFSATTFSLVLKHLVYRLRRLRSVLSRIKVYTGSSILRLFVYIEDPDCVLEQAVHYLCHAVDWVKLHTGSSILDLSIYIADSSYHAAARTATASLFADVEQIVAPSQPQNSNVVQQVAKWNIAKLFTAYILPAMLKAAVAFGVSGVGIFVDLWWHFGNGDPGELITQEEQAQDTNHREGIVVQTDDVEIPPIVGTNPQQHATTQRDEDDFMDVLCFLFDLRLIFLDHQATNPTNCRGLPTSTTINVTLPPSPSISQVMINEEFSTFFVDENSIHEEDEAYAGTSPPNHRVLLTPATAAVDVRESHAVENVTAPFSPSSKPMVSEELTGFVDEVLPATHEQDVGHTSEEDDDMSFHSLPDVSVSSVVLVEARMPFMTDSFVDSEFGMEGGSGSYIEEVIEERLEEKDEDSERSDLKPSLAIQHGERVVTDTPFLAPTLVQVSDIDGPAIPLPISLPKRVLELRLSSFGSPFPLRQSIFHSTPKQMITSLDVASTSYSTNDSRSLCDTPRLDFVSVSESCGSQSSSAEEVEQPTLVEADAGFFGKADLPLSKLHIMVKAEGFAPDCKPRVVGLAELVGEKSVWEGLEVQEDLDVALESAVVTADEEEPFVELPNSAVEEKLVEALYSSTFTPADEAPIGSQEHNGEDSSSVDLVDGDGVYRDFMSHLPIHHSVIPLIPDGPAVPISPPRLVYEGDEDEEAEGLIELLVGLFNEPILSPNDNHEEVDEELLPQSPVIRCHNENAGYQHCGGVPFDLSAALYGPGSRQGETAPIEDGPGSLFCPPPSSTRALEVPPTSVSDPVIVVDTPHASPSDPREDVKLGQPSCMLLEDPTVADENVPEAGSTNNSGPKVVDVNTVIAVGTDGSHGVSAHVDLPAVVAEAEEKQKTWPFQRVMRESRVLQDQEDSHRWQLRPVSTTPSPGPPEENEFQRMRAALRRPANMTDQEKRLRQVWELHGTERGRALKEQRLRRTHVARDSD